MVLTIKPESERVHEILHGHIYSCKCKPWRKGVDYCKDCQKAVVDFMNTHGAGILCRDQEFEDLKKQVSKLYKEKLNLMKRLEEKIKRVEELKARIKSSGISVSINSDMFDDLDSQSTGKVTK